jgi:DNA-binding MurR/RpiR family transcriptional regulator
MLLPDRIQKFFPYLSANRKKIAEYISSDGTTASFAGLRELATKIGVSESSIVRFAQDLGYSGYPELRLHLQDEVKKKLGSAERMRRTLSSVGKKEDLLLDLFHKDIELIEETLAVVTSDQLSAAIGKIWGAERVFIIGLRSSFALAYFLYFRLVRLQIDARLISVTGGTSLFEQLALLRPRDLLVAIGFAGVPDETNIAMDHSQTIGATVLGITYPATSEIGRRADILLLAKRGDQSRVQSLTAPFCLLNVLAIGVATAKQSRSLKALSDLDKMDATYVRNHSKIRPRKRPSANGPSKTKKAKGGYS